MAIAVGNNNRNSVSLVDIYSDIYFRVGTFGNPFHSQGSRITVEILSGTLESIQNREKFFWDIVDAIDDIIHSHFVESFDEDDGMEV